jgi:hypothetical protein
MHALEENSSTQQLFKSHAVTAGRLKIKHWPGECYIYSTIRKIGVIKCRKQKLKNKQRNKPANSTEQRSS